MDESGLVGVVQNEGLSPCLSAFSLNEMRRRARKLFMQNKTNFQKALIGEERGIQMPLGKPAEDPARVRSKTRYNAPQNAMQPLEKIDQHLLNNP
jgi:hypothetical protein